MFSIGAICYPLVNPCEDADLLTSTRIPRMRWSFRPTRTRLQVTIRHFAGDQMGGPDEWNRERRSEARFQPSSDTAISRFDDHLRRRVAARFGRRLHRREGRRGYVRRAMGRYALAQKRLILVRPTASFAPLFARATRDLPLPKLIKGASLVSKVSGIWRMSVESTITNASMSPGPPLHYINCVRTRKAPYRS
jgi:hypothetical protein